IVNPNFGDHYVICHNDIYKLNSTNQISHAVAEIAKVGNNWS
ncbi:10602_t:CDS:1, partial [Entrophospora sp. SA101]